MASWKSSGERSGFPQSLSGIKTEDFRGLIKEYFRKLKATARNGESLFCCPKCEMQKEDIDNARFEMDTGE
jgi:hypothetical protein